MGLMFKMETAAPTIKFVLLTAMPFGPVTRIGPSVAPTGTVVTISVSVAEVMTAVVPLNAQCSEQVNQNPPRE